MAASNLSGERAIAFLENTYADQVSYYGKLLDRAAVLKDKMAFFQRWPNRDYAVLPKTLKVICITPSSCVADGVMSWTDRRPDLISTGTANFSLGWSLIGNDLWRIVSETGHVINRNVGHQSSLALASMPSDTMKPDYQLDASSSKVVSLSNLSSDHTCVLTSPITGTLVDRQFGTDGLTMTGVIVETPDGERTFVNVEVDLTNADMVTRGWVMRGLRTLLAKGHAVTIGVRACGAAGRVLELDAARLEERHDHLQGAR